MVGTRMTTRRQGLAKLDDGHTVHQSDSAERIVLLQPKIAHDGLKLFGVQQTTVQKPGVRRGRRGVGKGKRSRINHNQNVDGKTEQNVSVVPPRERAPDEPDQSQAQGSARGKTSKGIPGKSNQNINGSVGEGRACVEPPSTGRQGIVSNGRNPRRRGKVVDMNDVNASKCSKTSHLPLESYGIPGNVSVPDYSTFLVPDFSGIYEEIEQIGVDDTSAGNIERRFTRLADWYSRMKQIVMKENWALAKQNVEAAGVLDFKDTRWYRDILRKLEEVDTKAISSLECRHDIKQYWADRTLYSGIRAANKAAEEKNKEAAELAIRNFLRTCGDMDVLRSTKDEMLFSHIRHSTGIDNIDHVTYDDLVLAYEGQQNRYRTRCNDPRIKCRSNQDLDGWIVGDSQLRRSVGRAVETCIIIEAAEILQDLQRPSIIAFIHKGPVPVSYNSQPDTPMNSESSRQRNGEYPIQFNSDTNVRKRNHYELELADEDSLGRVLKVKKRNSKDVTFNRRYHTRSKKAKYNPESVEIQTPIPNKNNLPMGNNWISSPTSISTTSNSFSDNTIQLDISPLSNIRNGRALPPVPDLASEVHSDITPLSPISEGATAQLKADSFTNKNASGSNSKRPKYYIGGGRWEYAPALESWSES